MDAHANFGYGTVLTAPSPASSGTSLVLNSGQGALMPTVPFNATVWPIGVQPLSSNAEIVRVTALSGDTLGTIARAQESSSARAIIAGDQFAATVTKKTLTDIEAAVLPSGVNDGDSMIWNSTTSTWVAVRRSASAAMNAFLGQSMTVEAAASAAATILTSGTLYVFRVPVEKSAVSATRTVWLALSTAGSSLTGGQSLVAVYNAAGTQLGTTSSDQAATWAGATGVKSTATVGTFALTSGVDIYIQLLSVGSTPPIFRGAAGSTGAQMLNANVLNAQLRVATNGTTQTSMPGSITPGSLSNIGANSGVWVAIT